MIRGQAPIIRSDGTLIRDYIYVEDAVSAYMTLTENLVQNKNVKGQAFNFSNESQYTVLDLTRKIIRILESTLEPIIEGNNQGEIQAQYLDSTKAITILGWKPKFTLEEGLKKTVSWYQSYLTTTGSCKIHN